MRIPANSFSAADTALCRAHGDAVGALVRASDVREPLAADYNLGLAGWLLELDAGKQPKKQAVTIVPSPSMAERADTLSRLADSSSASQGDAYVGAKQPEPAADVWHSEAPSVAGVYIASAFHNASTLRWFDGTKWHIENVDNASSVEAARNSLAEPSTHQRWIEWLRLVEADEPAAKQERATCSVCIKAHVGAPENFWAVGEIFFGRPNETMSPINWLPCDEDGWVTHEPKADSVCPVPDGVAYEARYGDGTAVAGTEAARQPDYASLWRSTSGSEPSNDIVAWRPTRGAA